MNCHLPDHVDASLLLRVESEPIAEDQVISSPSATFLNNFGKDIFLRSAIYFSLFIPILFTKSTIENR
jgi:hypothetical protein